MNINIHTLIGEATAYDKKEKLERNKFKSFIVLSGVFNSDKKSSRMVFPFFG